MSSASPARSGRLARLGWPLGVVVAVLVPALLLLAGNHRYFFYGDTQAAYLGWEYHLGEQLRAGHWPLLDVHRWRAGNLAAEGQPGLFSPLIMGLALVSTTVGDVLVFATVVKLALVCLGALGVFALARSYDVRAPLAFVAGVVVPLGGMTQYLDLSSWLAGLMIWSLTPWAWWALRRTMAGANPLPALAIGYLLVTVGYVYGTIMLILVLLACLLDCRVQGDRAAARRVFVAGLVCGAVAVAVYLPGVLTGPVTIRGFGFALVGKFDLDTVGLFTSVLPSASTPGTTLHLLPYAYLGWFLPALLWLDVDRVRAGWRPLAGLLAMTAAMTLLVLGPAQLGPLRWPLRLQPFLVQAVVVGFVVALSRFTPRPTARRLWLALGWVLVAGVVAAVRAPSLWPAHLVVTLCVAAAVTLLWALVRGGWAVDRLPATAGILALVSVGLTVLQHAYFAVPPSPERHLPAATADYRRPLVDARGDVMVLGNMAAAVKGDPAVVRDVLDGNGWYLNPHRVQNTYTTISFHTYFDRYCIEYDGSTCPQALSTLFAREPATGMRRVDLLGVSTLLLLRADFDSARLAAPPTGWRVADATPYAVTWVRTRPVAGAGRPVWTSSGTSVRLVSSDDRTARFRVAAVPSGGGRVVLSRMAWPGYRTDAGTLTSPVDGYLVGVDLPGSSVGRTVTVRFSPPGWLLEVATWWLGVVGGLGWCLALTLRARGVRWPVRRRP